MIKKFDELHKINEKIGEVKEYDFELINLAIEYLNYLEEAVTVNNSEILEEVIYELSVISDDVEAAPGKYEYQQSLNTKFSRLLAKYDRKSFMDSKRN